MKIVIAEHHRYRSVVRVGSHQIATELLRRGHQVVWLSHPKSCLHRLRGPLPPRLTRHEDGVVEVTARPLAPYVDLPVLGSLAWGRRWLSVGCGAAEQLRQADAGRCDLLWLSDFTMLPILDLVEAEQVIFRVFDHVERYRRMPRSILDLMRLYRQQADLIVASSQSVRRSLAEIGVSATYLPNGADLRLESPEPAERAQREDRVTYVGALGPWFDLAAVEYWAAAMPAVCFDIAGPNPDRLRSSLPNVRFLGPVPYEKVPELLLGSRFGIIPFRVDEFTRGIHPLKLYEYLGAGCPVLSSDLPEVREDPCGIFKYECAKQGLEVLEQNLYRPFDRTQLWKIAQKNSWSERLDRIAGLLDATAL